jgi:glycine/D-amino acid oxidase-like deaminating enzyme
MWDALAAEVDVAIIGGGIVGAGTARDAARRGLRVALVEMNDLASATSSRSIVALGLCLGDAGYLRRRHLHHLSQ